PELEGTRAVDVFLQRSGGCPVIAVSAAPDIERAVEALRHGAVNYLGVQDEPDRIQAAVRRALEEARSTKSLDRVRQSVHDQYGFNQLLTQSPRMLEVFDQIRAVAVTDATVLIWGETGTGKELVSRAIHERSRRQEQPFISVNCGAFTESLLESELFGHEKGAFTGAVGLREGLFEMADGGTLFLDELGETSLNVQVNLLRVLEDMTFRRVGGRDSVQVNVRIVAATNVHLDKAVAEGKFRQDLFFRLSVFPIRLPPLRERREDIPLLMRHFLDEIAEEYGLEPPVVATEAMHAILTYRWPGNVRQLRAMCERWVITRSGQRLEREHLEADISGHGDAAEAGGSLHVDERLSMKDNLLIAQQQVEKAYLFKALTKNVGHLGKTADFAGITRRTLYTKMKQYGLEAREFRGEE
ncbi:MAG: AAA domain-containing protein, partial [Rhodobacterales bacterium]|nr:AAA domain-containing protein [Rhodobacterales bacterium]